MIFQIRQSEPLPGDKFFRPFRSLQIFNYLREVKKVTFLTSNYDHFNKLHRRAGKEINFNSSKIRLFKTIGYKKNFSVTRLISDIQFGIKIFLYLSFHLSKDDIVFSSWPNMFCNVSSAAITKIKGAPFFIEVRDLWPFYILEKAKEQNFFIRFVVFLLYPFAIFLFKFSLSAASIIYVPAEGYREKIISLLPNVNIKISRIPFSESDCENIKINPLEYKKNNIKKICFFGSLTDVNDFSFIHELSNNLHSKYEFHIYGDGPNENILRDSFLNRSNVYFHGKVDQSELKIAAQHAAFSFAPYIESDNFHGHITNKIAEYMFYQLPILHTLPGECELLLKQNRLGAHFEVNHPHSFEQALDSLNSYIDEDISKRFEETFKNNFDPRSITNEIINDFHLIKNVQ